MVGQEELRARLTSPTSVTGLPNSMLFLGDRGCGKHTLAGEVASHYGLPLVDITNNISYEGIAEIYLNPLQAFYLVDMDSVGERQQNALLKFIEEPLPNSFIILLASSRNILLETIVNRCVAYEFRPYTREELMQFISEEDRKGMEPGELEDILSLCTTPGQVLGLNIRSLRGLHELCANMVSRMAGARYSNTLTIARKLNYKDEYDKYDFKVFLNCYRQHLAREYINSRSAMALDMYNIVSEECGLLSSIPNINREYLVEHMLTRLWERSRKG